jgi:hypothetical protein
VIWDNVKWQRLIHFLLIVSTVAIFIQWLFERSLSPASIWGYVGTASIAFFIGLTAINRRLWRFRIMKRRLFGWVTNMPDISGEWNVEMRPGWKDAESFLSCATIRQNLFSVQVEIRRPASYSRSLSASLFSTGENWWKFACVYRNEAGSTPEEHTVAQHYGCLLLEIEKPGNSNRMSGPYWTNKNTEASLSQVPGIQSQQATLGKVRRGDPFGARIPVYATAGHAIFTRNDPDKLSNSANISPG